MAAQVIPAHRESPRERKIWVFVKNWVFREQKLSVGVKKANKKKEKI